MERLTDVVNVQRMIIVQPSRSPNFRFVEVDRRTAAQSAPCSCRCKPSPGSLLNQTALELSKCREDVKDQLARRARRIDEAVADRPKADTAITQILNELDQVVHRATESIQPPDHKRVALLQLGKASIQLGRSVFAPEIFSVKMSSRLMPRPVSESI